MGHSSDQNMGYNKEFSIRLTDSKIREKFLHAKYGKDVYCDFCNSSNVERMNENMFRCRECREGRKKFSVTKNTHLAGWVTPTNPDDRKKDWRFWYELICCFVSRYSATKTKEFLKLNHKPNKPYQIIRKALSDYSERNWQSIVGSTSDIWIDGKEVKRFGETFTTTLPDKLIDPAIVLKKIEKNILELSERMDEGLNSHGFLIFVGKACDMGANLYLKKVGCLSDVPFRNIRELLLKKIAEAMKNPLKGYDRLIGLGCFYRKKESENMTSGAEIIQLYRSLIPFVEPGEEELDFLMYIPEHKYLGSLLNIYKKIPLKYWEYYLKEMEFFYNNRRLEFSEKVNKIIKILMEKPLESSP